MRPTLLDGVDKSQPIHLNQTITSVYSSALCGNEKILS